MRTSSFFFTSAPHWEHIWEVPLGSTSITLLPAHSALLWILSLSNPRELLTKPRVMLFDNDLSHSLLTFSLSMTIMSLLSTISFDILSMSYFLLLTIFPW